MAEKYSDHRYNESADLTEIFVNWFDFLNTKSTDKILNKGSLLMEPFNSKDSPIINHLKQFKEWLSLQELLKNKSIG